MSASEVMLKCIFVGNLSVGKTSVILRYTKDEFTEGYIPTIGADFTTTFLKINDNEEKEILQEKPYILKDLGLSFADYEKLNQKCDNKTKIYIWDVAGQPLFKKIRTYYISHAFLAIVALDLSSPETFKIGNWIKDIKSYSPNSDFILIGNKSDLVNLGDKNLQKKIKKEIENKFKKPLRLVSAKSGEGIKEVFIEAKLNIMKRL